jgi:CHAT domain-containing protein/Tfp pilus assembly protein PilF
VRSAFRRAATASDWQLSASKLRFLTVLLVPTVFVLVLGCNRVAAREALYDRIVSEIQHGDLPSASADIEKGLQLYAPRSEEWSWRFRVLKAQVAVSQSKADDALALLQGDLPPKLLSSEVAVQKLRIEGIAYQLLQDFGKSKERFSQAEHVAEVSQPALLSDVLNSKGGLEFDEKQYPQAEASFLRAHALALERQSARQEAAALINLARISTIHGHFGEAMDRHGKALDLAKSNGFKSFEATSLGNLGWGYFQLGDFVNAMDSFKQAIEGSQRTALTGRTFYWQGFLAQTYQELNDYSSAKALLKTTVQNASTLDNKQTMTENLNYLVRLCLKTGQFDEAQLYSREALQIEDAGLDHFGVLETQLLAGRIATMKKDLVSAERHFRRVIQDPVAETFLKWEAQTGLAEMYEAESLPLRAEREYRNSIVTFEHERSTIDRDDLRISFLARGMASYEAYIDFLMRHGHSMEALKVAEQSRSRTLEEGLASATLATSASSINAQPQEIAKKFKASLLFYWIGQKNSYLWVISPVQTNYFKLPAASEIDPVVAAYRKHILEMHDAEDEGSAEGEKLYTMLVEPAKELIPAGSPVIILPSESLYGLNFETLIAPGPRPHFWIEDITLTTGSSLTLLAASSAQPQTKDKSLFLVGDTKPPNPPFAPLPQAAEEMKQVKKYFPGAQTRVLEGKSATPSAVLKSNPEQYSYLHFVTHGTASHTRPLESAVILSQEGDSYKLYARDILQHRLKANLVTISACNGSGTRAYVGEGLVGLSWAFLRAGAHNVIGALWEVSDSSTPQLMDAFYRELFLGKDPATALRNAKLGLLHSADPESVFKNPFYWAPFQLYAGS